MCELRGGVSALKLSVCLSVCHHHQCEVPMLWKPDTSKKRLLVKRCDLRKMWGNTDTQQRYVESHFARGVLLTKESGFSFAEAHRRVLSEPTHTESEYEDQENEVEDEREFEECKVESGREVRHTSA